MRRVWSVTFSTRSGVFQVYHVRASAPDVAVAKATRIAKRDAAVGIWVTRVELVCELDD